MSFLIPFEFHKGDRLDDMTIIQSVARGGNGDLYLVRDDSENILALKVIRKPDNDGERNGIEQCRAVSSHVPGLVPILKTGKFADGRVYCVMPPADNMAQWPEYKPDTLADRIRQYGRIPPDEVLEIANSVLATIKALHDAGLSHCDIKPENILFLNGNPMLSDYSLLSDSAEHSAEVHRAAAGTIGFVPPEMLEYRGNYDPRSSDLYAVGKIIYCAWTGTDVVMFPSVPKDIDLHEIGIMRPLYMKACNASPNGRFKNADEFISAVSGARFRLNHSARAQVRSNFRKNLPVLLFVLLILLCLIGLANILFLIRMKDGGTKREQAPVPGASDLFYIEFPNDSKAAGGNTLPPDPLIVTTDLDVVDANDGVNSLREAFNYAQTHGAGATVSFLHDCEIKLSSPLSVTQNIIIDGGENRVILTGPETEPMFQVNESKLTLKNMSLISNRAGGGILDAGTPGRVVLSSVKDGGNAKCLWCISGKIDMDLEDGSHLHRVQVMPQSGGGNIRIKAGSVLEDLEYAGDSRNMGEGNCDVYENGLLKNASVADVGDIYVNPGGTAENITVKKNGFLVIRPGGKIDGAKVEFGGVMGYMDKGIVTGTISISGVAWEPGSFGLIVDGTQAFPVIDDKRTDIVFDLTERTEDSRSWFTMNVEVRFAASKNIIEGPEATRLLFNDLASFLGAHSYTVRVGTGQPDGMYLLGTQADKFDSAVSLVVGDKVYPDALIIGKPFSAGNKVYTLILDYWESRNNSWLTNYEVRTLMLRVGEEAVPYTPVQVRGTFGIRVDTAPGANVLFTSPDGKDQWKETADGNGVCKTVVETPGNYSVSVSKDNYQPVNDYRFDVSGPGNGNITHVDLPLNPEDIRLLVTTDKDAADPDDGVTSLREALEHARKQGSAATVTFANDYTIKLSSPLPVLDNVTIAGGKNKVTLIGPEGKPMFLENGSGSGRPQMILVNMSLSESDADGLPGRAEFVLTGTFGGAGTFVFQDGKITYRHKEWLTPSDVRVNGKKWNDLNQPFDLGSELSFLTGTFVEKDKQRGHTDDTQLRTSPDRAELDINNSFTSPAYYRVALSFQKRSADKWKSVDADGRFSSGAPATSAP